MTDPIHHGGLVGALKPQAPDALLSLIGLYRADVLPRGSPELSADWRGELGGMRRYIVDVRLALAGDAPGLAPLIHQHGRFARAYAACLQEDFP